MRKLSFVKENAVLLQSDQEELKLVLRGHTVLLIDGLQSDQEELKLEEVARTVLGGTGFNRTRRN